MRQLLIDFRYAARQILRSPGFSLTVILILACGIGMTAAVISVVDHVLFRPLDLPASDRIVTLCEVRKAEPGYCSASPANAADWQDNARTVSAVGVARQRSVQILRADRRTAVAGAMVTPGFLRVIGVAPLHGRLLQDSDMLPHGSATSIVLSEELWRSEFGAERNIIGSTVRISSGGDGRVLDQEPFTVIGVLPAGLDVPRMSDVRAWIPLQMDPRAEEDRGWRGFVALARLTTGATVAEAQADLNRVQAALAEAHPEDVGNWTVDVHPVRDWIVRDVRSLLLLFMGAVALVLAIVCVNVVTLLLARASSREREMMVLAALGAGSGPRKLILESLFLAVLGGVAGVILAMWLVQALVLLAPAGLPRVEQIAIDVRVLLIVGVVTLSVGIVFSIVPALRLRNARIHELLRARAATGDARVQRVRRLLVATQLALALALLLSASLLLRSFNRLAAYDPGFDIDGVVAFQLFPSMTRYETREQRRRLYDDVAAALQRIPGVTAVGSASAGPLLAGGDGRAPFIRRDRPATAVQDAPTAEWFDAGAGYFPALGVPILAGRNLSVEPTGDVTEVLINDAMARRHWQGESPVGARIFIPGWEVEGIVVGVVRDMRVFGSSTPPDPAIFVSSVHRPRGASYFVVRTRTDAAAIMPAVRAALSDVDADLEPVRMATMHELLRDRLVAPRFNLLLISVFAVLALVLSTSGVYALIAYIVALRSREFGIRIALGAHASQVLLAVMLDSARVLAAGLILGAIGAFFFARLVRAVVSDLAPSDGYTALGATALLCIAALAAAAAPARRAARTDPAVVLRTE